MQSRKGLLAVVLLACSPDDQPSPPGAGGAGAGNETGFPGGGGQTGTGGAGNQGGTAGKGGATNQGGAAGKGGATSQGGTAGKGGALSCSPGFLFPCTDGQGCEGNMPCKPDGSGFLPCKCVSPCPAGKTLFCDCLGGMGHQTCLGNGLGYSPCQGCSFPGGAGGGGCTPKNKAEACGLNQCGLAVDGCDGLVECGTCPIWLICKPGEGEEFPACRGQCFPVEDNGDCKNKFGEEYSLPAFCPEGATDIPSFDRCRPLDFNMSHLRICCRPD